MNNTTKEKAIIFDLDDTLIACGNYYVQARKALAEKLTTILEGVTEQEVLDLIEQIDHENFDYMRFNALRFPYSMAKTYQVLTEKHPILFDPVVATECFALGMHPLNEKPMILPGVEDMLADLDAARIYILTAGSEDVQKTKLLRTGLIEYFQDHHIFIFEQKTPSEMNQVIELIQKEHGLGKKDIFMVGDSLMADIQTAITCEIQPVHIETDQTWSMLKASIDGSFKRVKSAPEAIEYIFNA